MKDHETYLEKNPEEVGEDTTGAGACSVCEVVEHVGHSTGEGQHDDKEGDQEHQYVLHRMRGIAHNSRIQKWLIKYEDKRGND
jgi:hypothetical protein